LTFIHVWISGQFGKIVVTPLTWENHSDTMILWSSKVWLY